MHSESGSRANRWDYSARDREYITKLEAERDNLIATCRADDALIKQVEEENARLRERIEAMESAYTVDDVIGWAGHILKMDTTEYRPSAKSVEYAEVIIARNENMDEHETITELRQQLEAAEQHVKIKDDQVNELGQQLESKDEFIENFQGQITRLEQKRDELRQKLEEAKKLLIKDKNTIDAWKHVCFVCAEISHAERDPEKRLWQIQRVINWAFAGTPEELYPETEQWIKEGGE